MRVVDYLFLGIYTIEVALRLAVHRLYFFINDDYMWNIFDIALVFLGYSFLLSADIADTEFLRSLRILRVANKLVRVVRLVHFVSELRLMLQCVLGSLRSLVWALVLLMGFTIVFSILLVQQFANAFTMNTSSPFTDSEIKIIDDSFGSVYKSMIALFKSITGGADWGDFYNLARILVHLVHLYSFCIF